MKVLAITLLLVLSGSAAAQNWQYSTGPEMHLQLRDKFGDAEYSINYTITYPNGTVVKAATKASGAGFAGVYFPSAFSGVGDVNPGTYKWAAHVNGKIAVAGSFVAKKTPSGDIYFYPN